MSDYVQKLIQNDNQEAFQELTRQQEICVSSNELYPYFEEYLSLLTSESSFKRIRGFRMICVLAKYDTLNLWEKHFEEIKKVFFPANGVEWRKHLESLSYLKNAKPFVFENFILFLTNFNRSALKPSMQELIEKDLDKLRK
jgi:hypothetical protein